MVKAKISEIFSSIQGEGKYAGVRQIFVRFFGCNIHCSWCDTPASIGDTSRHYKSMTVEEVFFEIQKLWPNCHSVSLTGGEPLLQKNFVKKLLPLLREAKMPVYLETSGILPKELAAVIDEVDIVAMDFKLPSSTKEKEFWKEHEQFLKIALAAGKDVFIKTVITADTTKKDIERAVKLVAHRSEDILFILQPNTYDLKNGVIEKCVDFHNYSLQYLSNSRIMPQMHKFMKLP